MKWIKSLFFKPKIVNPFEELSKINFKGKKIVILTGAGISKESGIATFRENGIYDKNPELLYLLRPDTLETNPQFLYNFHDEFKKEIDKANPNQAHVALSKLSCNIITQNIDNLHQRAGSKDVVHMHGNLYSCRCEICNRVYQRYFQYNERCECGGRLRNNIVLFKEPVLKIKQCFELINSADIFVQIGSSGVIYPAAGFINEFHKNNPSGISICIDTKEPDNLIAFKFFIKGPSSEKVPQLVNLFLD